MRKAATGFIVPVLLMLEPLSALARYTGDTQSALTLARAVAMALERSPDLYALSARAEALAALPPQEGAMPDPVLSLNAMNLPSDTFDTDQEPMTQLQLGISQKIPFPGKRRLRRETATAELRASKAKLKEGRNVLINKVRSAWWRLFSLERSLAIVQRNQDLVRDFVDLAQTKYTVGGGRQQDVLLAQLELSKLLGREARLQGKRRGAKAQLNGLLNRAPDHELIVVRTPASIELPEVPPEEDLLMQARDSREVLNIRREMLNAARHRLELAERDRYPDFRLGAGYGYRQGEDPMRGEDRADFFSVLFSINVPVYAKNKQNRKIEQRISERAASAFALSSAARRIETEIGRKIAEYEAAREQVRILDGAIIPQAEQTVASMLAGYQVNQVDFLNVINGQLSLYNAQINYWMALADAKGALAGLAAAVGQEALYE